MWLSDLSIRQPVFITMVTVAVMVVGAISYTRMGVDLFPDVTLPVMVVQTTYPGASPEEVERSVTGPVEEAVASLDGVENVRSTTSDSLSLVVVEFVMSKDGDEAADDVRARIGQVRNALPDDVQEPVILQFDPSASPIVAYAVADRTGRLSADQLRALADSAIKPRLEQVEGVAAVEVAGGRDREVHVELVRDQLEAHGIAPQQVIQAIRTENIELPSGRVPNAGREESLRVAGELQSLAQLAELPVAKRPDGTVVNVADVATVTEGYADERVRSRLDGQRSIVVNVRKQSGTNTVQVADGVAHAIVSLRQTHPDLDFVVAFDQSAFTREAVQDVQLTLLLGAALAALVVLLFFRDLRNTLITIAGLPVIVLGTFGVLHLFGITLNMISMMGLSLSIGMLIDDAIVVRENIFRHVERGAEPREAAARGTAEIALAVVAVTSTIVAVFLPIAFTEGIAGRFLRDFGVTIAVAVLISLVEAFTLAPMLSAFLFSRTDPTGTEHVRTSLFGRAAARVTGGYRQLLGWSLSNRLIVVLVGVGTFVGSLTLIPHMVFSFQTEPDEGHFTIGLELAPGTPLAKTDATASAIEQVLRSEPATAHVLTTIGSTSGPAERATIDVELHRRGETDAVLERLRPELERASGGAKLTIARQSSMASAGGASVSTFRGRPIQFTVQGQDFAQIDRVSAEVAARLQEVPGAVDVDRSIEDQRPSSVIALDRARARDLGVSATQVGTTLRALVNGERAGTYRAGDAEVDIVVRLSEPDRRALRDVLRLPIVTTQGTQLPLAAVANVISETEPSQIDRENRQRQVTVGAGTHGRNPASVLADARSVVEEMELPPGVTIAASGQARYQDEMFASLGLALGLALLFVYMVLASQFGSFVHPFTIMLALPFSIVGALGALYVSRFTFDMLAMIGIILLMGLATKNSILLVDFVNQLKRQGVPTREAILAAGPIRLRPILMTTLAMILGMTPLAAGIGAGAELRQAMGISVIGGLISSTLLTLVFVPVAYSLVDDLSRFLVGNRRESYERSTATAPTARRIAIAIAALTVLTVGAAIGFGLIRSRTPRSDVESQSSVVETSGAATPTAQPPSPSAVVAADPSAQPTPIVAVGAGPAAPAQSPLASGDAPTDRRAPGRDGQPQIANTNGLGANLRDAPGTSARRVTALPEGATLERLDEATDASGIVWVKVRDARGSVGWVVADYVGTGG